MNLINLLAHIPTAAWLGFVISVVLPALSAALVRAHWDSAITGVLTLGLSTATGFCTEWAHAGDSFHWQTAAALAAGSWLIAALTQARILSGTQLEAWLLALGTKLKPYDGTSDTEDPTAGMPLAFADPVAVTPADPGQPAAGVPPAETPAPTSPTVA